MFNVVSNLDTNYLSSVPGGKQLMALATGGGIFGIIANNNMHVSSLSGQAILWVAVFAWVTTLFDYVTRAYGKKVLIGWGKVTHLIWVTSLYIVVTVIWAVYDTYNGAPIQPRPVLVFVLAILTTVNYFEQLVRAGLDTRGESCCEENKTAVVENGKKEDKPADSEQAQTSG
uniref:Uncharacterized protein LOC100179987 n=1 Tax=Phallusia mammillata TaxID=59560 RepID=A0A6F9DH65_9ASCI|nr:uncharacterized protein LOC100179987 [Phallusia mammillata]